jgi:hypothetical protein
MRSTDQFVMKKLRDVRPLPESAGVVPIDAEWHADPRCKARAPPYGIHHSGFVFAEKSGIPAFTMSCRGKASRAVPAAKRREDDGRHEISV